MMNFQSNYSKFFTLIRYSLKRRMLSTLNQNENAFINNDILKKATVKPDLLKNFLPDNLRTEDYFALEKLISIEDMFNARIHLGHKIGTLNENMKWALYGERLGVCIIDLEISRKYLLRALNFIAHTAYNGGMLLFITTNKNAMIMVERMAEESGQYANTRKWQCGTLTNTEQVLKTTTRLPDTIIFLNNMTSSLSQHPAVIEAAKMVIPTVSVVDTNSDPNLITYPIPGNDDSIDSIKYYMEKFCAAINMGTERRALEGGQIIRKKASDF